jgi:hypothetical protein
MGKGRTVTGHQTSVRGGGIAEGVLPSGDFAESCGIAAAAAGVGTCEHDAVATLLRLFNFAQCDSRTEELRVYALAHPGTEINKWKSPLRKVNDARSR